MTTRTKKTLVAALVLLTAAVGLVVFALRPGSNGLHVHVETIRDEDGHFHRRWTFTGAGRWESFGVGTRAGEHFVVLDRPGVRDSASIRFLKDVLVKGADRIVYEVEVRRMPPEGPAGSPLVSIRRVLSGNGDGGSPGFTRSATVPMTEAPWRAQFEAIPVEDARLPVPAKIRLGEFGGVTETIEFR